MALPRLQAAELCAYTVFSGVVGVSETQDCETVNLCVFRLFWASRKDGEAVRFWYELPISNPGLRWAICVFSCVLGVWESQVRETVNLCVFECFGRLGNSGL